MFEENTLWGNEIASVILTDFLPYLHKSDFTSFAAGISKINYGSIKIFQKAGLARIGNKLDGDMYLLDYNRGGLNIGYGY